MAVKDHTLDDKIIQAAKKEFLQYGFQKASLHKIADQAGITTGALYTRYKNKDDLFCSLVRDVISRIAKEFEPFQKKYEEVQKNGNMHLLLDVIREEEQVYLNIMFEYYEECVLFFCRSDGSSIGSMIEKMMAEKARGTIAFLKSMAKKEIDFDGIEFIMSEQFHYYRQIMQKGYTKEKALSCMETVEMFLEAGWKELFERIL